jgi:UDP-perosamine 4-acetyltransferase
MRVAILGAGGLGKVILEAFVSKGEHEVVGFLDDQASKSFCGRPILGKLHDLELLQQRKVAGVCLALGDRFLQERIQFIRRIRKMNLRAVNAIHDTAWVSPSAKLGQGIYVGPQACIHAGAKVGDFSTIWSGCIVEHDCQLGENCFLAPGAKTAGYTVLGDHVFLGIGAVLLRTKVGSYGTVGAGSLLMRDVEPKAIYWGNPAKKVGLKTKYVYHD